MQQVEFLAHRGFEFWLNKVKTICSRWKLRSARAWCVEREFGHARKEGESDGV